MGKILYIQYKAEANFVAVIEVPDKLANYLDEKRFLFNDDAALKDLIIADSELDYIDPTFDMEEIQVSEMPNFPMNGMRMKPVDHSGIRKFKVNVMYKSYWGTRHDLFFKTRRLAELAVERFTAHGYISLYGGEV